MPSFRSLARPLRWMAAPVTAALLWTGSSEAVAVPADRAILAAPVQAGDTIVKLATRPRYPGGGVLVRELTIGSADGPAEYSLTRIGDVLLAHDGSLIVVDHGGVGPGATPFVRQYDANGRYLRTIGRKGQGPGEYLSPSGLAQLPDGRIVLRDGAQPRINVYSPAGAPVGNWRLDATARGFGAVDNLLVDTAGVVYRRETIRPRTESESSPPRGLVRMTADGRVIDTLPPPEMPELPEATMRATSPRGGRGAVVPYLPVTTWTWSPLGYSITGRTDRYAIDLRIPPGEPGASRAGASTRRLWKAGDPVVSIRRDVRAVPISDAERSARRRAVEAFFRVVDPGWSWNGPDIPRAKPFLREIRVASDGRIWAGVSMPSEPFTPPPMANVTGRSDGGVPFREPAVFEVFEPDGAFLGQVGIPYRTSIAEIKGDIVWLIHRDEDDVETLQRFRIAWK